MKILILSGSNSTYNQLRPEFEMFIGFRELGHDVTVVIRPDSVYVPRLREAGIRLLHCYPLGKISLPTIRALRAELRARDYDIIYATTSKTIPNAAIAALGFPVRLVTYRGTTGGAYRHDPTNYLTVLNPRADGIVCVSRAVRDYLQPKFSGSRPRLVTIYKGHDPSWYQNPPADLGEFGIPDSAFTIACVANARPYKGLSYLLEATRRLSAIGDLHLLLVGQKIDTPAYLEQIERSGMAERIHLAGFRHDAPELIAACQTLVLPSLREGLPRVVLEAMGYGVPPIVTNSGGCAEVVEDGVSGFIVPIADADAIAAKVEQLYADPVLRASMSAASRHALETDVSVRASTQKYLKFFAELSGAN